MNIALTGATGFVGRYVATHLARAGHRLICWYRRGSDLGHFPADVSHGSLTWLEGALGDAAATERLLEGADAVVHSALHHPGGGFRGAEGDRIGFLEANLMGTLQLFEAARRRGIARFVFISSCAVHDRILPDRPLDETHPLWPESHYGAHKAALEAFVHSYGFGEGLPICAVRPTGVYGLAHPPPSSKWYPLVERIVRGEPVDCRRGGKEVHALDVARAVALLLQASAESVTGQSFNCCDRYVSEHEVATLARELSGSRSIIQGGPTAPRNQIDTTKLRALGMTFGGAALLRETIQQLVDSANGGSGD
jgi:nucleoside-diphosphate-sugar epimerase